MGLFNRVAKKVLQREEEEGGREEKKDLQELVYMIFSILDFEASGTGARVISCHEDPLEEQPVFLAAKAALQYGLCVNKGKQV